LPSFPFQGDDLLTVAQTPRIVFAGCQDKGKTGFIARENANVLILSLSKFSKSNMVLLVDFNEMVTYETFIGQQRTE